MDTIIHYLSIAVVILVSLTIHELSHGYVSYKLGDPTAKNMGRLTLNPIKHLDPFGTLMMILSMIVGVGFGWAKPVPINPNYYRNPKRGTMLTSIAGPLSNLLLSFIMIFPLLYLYGSFDIQSLNQYDAKVIIANFLAMLFGTNISLAIFNLIPVPPLDGSKILAGILPNKYYYKYLQNERYISFAFMILMFFVLYRYPGFMDKVVGPIERLMIAAARPIVSLFF